MLQLAEQLVDELIDAGSPEVAAQQRCIPGLVHRPEATGRALSPSSVAQVRLAIGRLQKLLPEGARPEQRARLDLDAISTQYRDRLLRRLEALGIRVAP